jgi:predicted DNA-binding transcriptional regulator AlpA
MYMHTQERDSFMRVKDVARELDQSVSAVDRKIAAGDLPAVRLGSSPRAPLRVPPEELEAWLYGARREPPASAAAAKAPSSRSGFEERTITDAGGSLASKEPQWSLEPVRGRPNRRRSR